MVGHQKTLVTELAPVEALEPLVNTVEGRNTAGLSVEIAAEDTGLVMLKVSGATGVGNPLEMGIGWMPSDVVRRSWNESRWVYL